MNAKQIQEDYLKRLQNVDFKKYWEEQDKKLEHSFEKVTNLAEKKLRWYLNATDEQFWTEIYGNYYLRYMEQCISNQKYIPNRNMVDAPRDVFPTPEDDWKDWFFQDWQMITY